MKDPSQAAESVPRRRIWPRLVVALILILILVVVAIVFRDDLQLANFVRYETELRQMQLEHVVLVYSLALFAYVMVTGFSIPAATALSLLYGWYFGFWRAVLVVSFASTAGATLAFLISRHLLGEVVRQRWGDRLERVNSEFEREGAFYLFTLRLLPVVPFFVVNAVMGLTPIRVRTFWWVSQLGMLPGTLVYVYAGSIAPDLRTLADRGAQGLPLGQIAVALTLLGLLPLVTRAVLRQRGRHAPS